MTVATILAQSSNVGAITLAQLLGRERLSCWVDTLRFGSKTGLDFPGETSGSSPELWSGSTIGTLPIGHGIAVTPVQMAAAYAAVANGGVWMQPHLVSTSSRVEQRRRRIFRRRREQFWRRCATSCSRDRYGAAVEGYQVAGQDRNRREAGPARRLLDLPLRRLVRRLRPGDDPRLVILVTVDEPPTIWGGVVAAPAFQEIARFALQYLEVPPETAPPEAPGSRRLATGRSS